MKISGKAMPPRAALLLSLDFAVLVILAPLLFLMPLPDAQSPNPVATLPGLLGLMLAGAVCQAIFYYHDLYNLQIVRVPRATVTRTLRAFAVLFLLLTIVLLILPWLTPLLSKVLFFSAFFAIVTLLTRRLVLPRHRERVLVIGTGDEAAELQTLVLSSPEWNMEVTEITPPAMLTAILPRESKSSDAFDRVIVTNVKAQPKENLETLLNCKMAGMQVEDAQSFFEKAAGRVRVDHLSAEQCIFSDQYSNRLGKRILKRAFDSFVAMVLLVAVSPLILIVALIIYLQREGPILFRQQRVGLFGKPFSILKFRTMSPVTAAQTTGWAGDETHRITPFGRYLRKYRIDELPQLVNVLRGEMSLIGPRPEQPHLCEILEQHIPFFKHRHSVLPGLTGWAQVRHHYSSSIEESKQKLEYDLFYIKHLSLWLDCAIALETVKVVLVGRGAV
jgi:exopolysaccharide biosynthesis polyprenyl glycosylphosphotransferase